MQANSNILIVNKTNANVAEILLYGYIGDFDLSANSFVRELRALEKDYSKINLRINSGGGSVFEGIAMYNAILGSSAEVNTYIDGLAGSMASIIALAGKRVYISNNATYMTHLPSTYTHGNSDNIKRSASLLESLEKTMLSIYAARTGKTEADCKVKFMNGKDNWFTAEQAVAEGLADEVFENAPVKAPVKAEDERNTYMQYAAMLVPTINYLNPDNTMNQIFFTPEQLEQLPGMKAGATPTQQETNTAFASLVAKAAKADQLENSLAQVKAELTREKEAFTAYKDSGDADAVATMLEQANKEGRTTVEQNKILAETYKGNPTGLKAWIATLQPQQSIVAALGGTAGAGAPSNRIAELMAKTGDELFRDGGFEELQALSPEQYKAKYKEWTGGEPQ